MKDIMFDVSKPHTSCVSTLNIGFPNSDLVVLDSEMVLYVLCMF